MDGPLMVWMAAGGSGPLEPRPEGRIILIYLFACLDSRRIPTSNWVAEAVACRVAAI